MCDTHREFGYLTVCCIQGQSSNSTEFCLQVSKGDCFKKKKCFGPSVWIPSQAKNMLTGNEYALEIFLQFLQGKQITYLRD